MEKANSKVQILSKTLIKISKYSEHESFLDHIETRF